MSDLTVNPSRLLAACGSLGSDNKYEGVTLDYLKTADPTLHKAFSILYRVAGIDPTPSEQVALIKNVGGIPAAAYLPQIALARDGVNAALILGSHEVTPLKQGKGGLELDSQLEGVEVLIDLQESGQKPAPLITLIKGENAITFTLAFKFVSDPTTYESITIASTRAKIARQKLGDFLARPQTSALSSHQLPPGEYEFKGFEVRSGQYGPQTLFTLTLPKGPLNSETRQLTGVPGEYRFYGASSLTQYLLQFADTPETTFRLVVQEPTAGKGGKYYANMAALAQVSENSGALSFNELEDW